MPNSVHVVAVLEAKPGKRDALLAAFADNLAAVLAEKGCITYVPSTDHDATQVEYGENTVVVVEQWATLDDLKAHSAAPHMAAFSKAVSGIVSRWAIHILKPS